MKVIVSKQELFAAVMAANKTMSGSKTARVKSGEVRPHRGGRYGHSA